MKKIFSWLKTIMIKMQDWSKKPKSFWGLGFLSFIESIFFPFPPDPLLLFMGIAKPKKVFFYAFITMLFSVLGGITAYFLGGYLWEYVSPFFLKYVFSNTTFESVMQKFNDNSLLTLITAGLTPIPFKVITLTSGIAKIPLSTFIFGCIIGRSLRFFLVAILVFFFGEKMNHLLNNHFEKLTIALGLLVIGLVVFVKFI